MYRAAWLEEAAWAQSSSCIQERETGQKLPCGTPVEFWVRSSSSPHYGRFIGINPAQETPIDTAFSRRPLTSLRSLTSVPSRVSCSCPLSESIEIGRKSGGRIER